MIAPSPFRWSLLTQALTLVTLLLISLVLGALWFLSDRQQADIEAILADQQMTLTANLVDEIEHKIDLQIRAVQRIGVQFTGDILKDPTRLSALLATRNGAVGFFPTGLVVLSPTGKTLGEYPKLGRLSRDYSAQPGLAETVTSGQARLSEPYAGPEGSLPLLAMLVPCLDANGKVEAVLMGEALLTDTNSLGSISDHHLGQTGGFYLVSAKSQRILLSTDKNRIFTPLPPPGANKLLDSIVKGYEGIGISVSSKGIEELLAARTLPSTGWKLIARLPTAEAFHPVETMKTRLEVTLGLIGLITLLLLSLLLARSLRPLALAAASVREMVAGDRPLEPVKAVGGGEVKDMLEAFNALQGKIVAAQSAEQAAHDRLRAMLDNMPIGVAVLSPERVLIEVNPQFRTIFGMETPDLQGKPSRVLYGDGEQHEELGRIAYPIMLAGGTFRDDVLMARQDGSAVWVRLTGHLVKTSAPSIGIIWTAEDISERHESEELLKAQTADLARSNAELETFAYAASHDLRQPLRQVASYVSLLERGYQEKLDDEAREYISFARSACERMDTLIVDLLGYARIGRSGREPAPVSMAEASAEAIENLAAAIAECDAEIILDVPDALPSVMGDRSELMRLMQNIIGNAIKYRAPGRRPKVEISGQCEEGWLHLSVADNGIGIAPEYFEKIFGIFQRLHSRADYEGTGIGLAVCKKIAEHHGGSIHVESGKDGGVTFQLSLPVS